MFSFNYQDGLTALEIFGVNFLNPFEKFTPFSPPTTLLDLLVGSSGLGYQFKDVIRSDGQNIRLSSFPIIDINGRGDCPKNDLLLVVLFILLTPSVYDGKEVGGDEQSVLFVNTSYTFNFRRLVKLIKKENVENVKARLNYLLKSLPKNKELEEKDTSFSYFAKQGVNNFCLMSSEATTARGGGEKLYETCFDRLHVVDVTDELGLLATLENLKNFIETQRTSILILNDLSSFYWNNRLLVKRTTGTRLRLQKTIYRRLLALRDEYKVTIICFNQAPYRRCGEELPWNLPDYSPEEWRAAVDIRINFWSSEPTSGEIPKTFFKLMNHRDAPIINLNHWFTPLEQA
ncbi:uncharacterized protein LOC135143568 [Zophobas morio]|jgi:hypothetical protein|uniref:uncharacterized protein LOC135143568 n=1 Tax=Zophobas morio TaxID=2755281 RepID=UPI0030826D17